MSERADRDFLSDIQESIRRIHDYTVSMTYETFLPDIKTQDAAIRNLEIVGEATKNLSAELRDRYPGVPWKAMAGVRDSTRRYFRRHAHGLSLESAFAKEIMM